MKVRSSLFFALALLIPSSVLAQSLTQIKNANDVVSRFLSIFNVVIYILMAFAVVYITYYTVIYLIRGKSGDENRREAGMQVLWGCIGIAVIVSLWGIVNILVNTFPTSNRTPENRFPNVNVVNTSGTNQLYDAPANYGQQYQHTI